MSDISVLESPTLTALLYQRDDSIPGLLRKLLFPVPCSLKVTQTLSTYMPSGSLCGKKWPENSAKLPSSVSSGPEPQRCHCED